MKDKVKELFDSVTPLWSDEELINNTLRKVETMENNENRRKKRFVKPLAAVCAAVAVMAAGTVTVGAIYNWNLSGFFRTAERGSHNLSSSDSVIANMGEIDFSRFGKPLDDVIEFEGGRMKMAALLHDMISLEFLYNVEFDEPEKFTDYHTQIQVEIAKVDKESGESELSKIVGTNGSDIINGTTYEYMSASFPQETLNDHYIRFYVKQINAVKSHYDEESDSVVSDSILLPVIGNAEILIDVESTLDESMIRTASGRHEITAYEKTLVIEGVRLSPLALNFETPADAVCDTLYDMYHELWGEGRIDEYEAFFGVKMSDGTVISVNNGSAGSMERDDGSLFYNIPILPVDASSAVAVIIGDVEIPLD